MRIFFAGAVAGAFASLITHPIDVIKTNHMVNPKISKYPYSKMVSYLYRESGLKGFARGLILRTIHMSIMSTIMLCGYEQFLYFFMVRITPF